MKLVWESTLRISSLRKHIHLAVSEIWKWKSLRHVQFFVSPRNSPGQNTGVGSHSLLQGVFPSQGLNPGLLHCRWILYQLSQNTYTREAQIYKSASSNPTSWLEWSLHFSQHMVHSDCITTQNSPFPWCLHFIVFAYSTGLVSFFKREISLKIDLDSKPASNCVILNKLLKVFELSFTHL